MGRITASRKQLVGDPKFGSLLASKFINVLMWDGKKSTAQSVFYKALDMVGERINEPEPIEEPEPIQEEEEVVEAPPEFKRCFFTGVCEVEDEE